MGAPRSGELSGLPRIELDSTQAQGLGDPREEKERFQAVPDSLNVVRGKQVKGADVLLRKAEESPLCGRQTFVKMNQFKLDPQLKARLAREGTLLCEISLPSEN